MPVRACVLNRRVLKGQYLNQDFVGVVVLTGQALEIHEETIQSNEVEYGLMIGPIFGRKPNGAKGHGQVHLPGYWCR